MTITRITRRDGLAGIAAVGAVAFAGPAIARNKDDPMHPDMILTNGRLTTLDPQNPVADAVGILNGRFQSVGLAREIMPTAGPETTIVDLGGRRAVPGLIDSHTHLIRGGLSYTLELRWDGVRSLSDAMAMLKAQAEITPPPHWVRVVGGFTEHQFEERRLPTLDEINRVAPETPVFIMRLYDRALLNRAALRAVGYTRDTPNPPGGEIQRDAAGEPTGLLLARPNASILYSTLAKGPKLDPDVQALSTRHFMRELNRLGITSVIDAGGGFQNYPDDYAVIEKLHRRDQMTVRVAYNLFTQKPREELADFERWTSSITPHQGDDLYRHNGAGEMLVYSAADFEDFREPRPEVPTTMGEDLEPVVRLLAEKRWPWRLHATYDETITQALDVFERVNRDVPFDGLHWIIDHAETISPHNSARVAALGGGVAIQHRMAFQGEDFIARYGERAAAATPPVARMLADGVKVGAGTDATRVASYNPWVCLSWLVTGKTVGGLRVADASARLDRETALRLWTHESAWFSTEGDKKGRLKIGQLADLIVLDQDYFSVPESAIADITADLTIVGGRIVHGRGPFADLAPPPPPAAPDWSPVRRFGGGRAMTASAETALRGSCGCDSACTVHGHDHAASLTCGPTQDRAFWGVLGCACWAV